MHTVLIRLRVVLTAKSWHCICVSGAKDGTRLGTCRGTEPHSPANQSVIVMQEGAIIEAIQMRDVKAAASRRLCRLWANKIAV